MKTNYCVLDPNFCSHKSNSYCRYRENEGTDCPCSPDYTENSGFCTRTRSFGCSARSLQPFDQRLNDPSSATYKETHALFNGFLTEAYSRTFGFIRIVIVRFSRGSTIADYIVEVNDSSNANADSLRNDFASFLNVTCNGSSTDANCTTKDGLFLQMDVNSSVNAVGNNNQAICSKPDNVDYCDTSSTVCNATTGTVICQCSPGYVPFSKTVCAKMVCSSDSDCNAPFGSCVASPPTQPQVGACSCITGFTGQNCYNPWLFVFIIVISFLVLVVIIVVIVMLVRKRKGSAAADFWISEMETGRGVETRRPRGVEATYYDRPHLRASSPKSHTSSGGSSTRSSKKDLAKEASSSEADL